MELSKILITETSDYQVIWLREKGGTRTFPILIGIVEAAAIDRKIRDIQTPRPLTHDLLANVIESMGAQLSRIVVCSLHSNTFYAKLVIDFNGHEIDIDSRPSDAVAVAVRMDAPIYVENDVLEHVCSGAGQPDTPDPSGPTIV